MLNVESSLVILRHCGDDAFRCPPPPSDRLEAFLNGRFVVDVAPCLSLAGPSSGLAMVVALVAFVTGCETAKVTGMTGAVSLDGSLGAVGGIPCKVRAASKVGVQYFIAPSANAGDEDAEELAEVLKDPSDVEVVYRKNVWEALREAVVQGHYDPPAGSSRACTRAPHLTAVSWPQH